VGKLWDELIDKSAFTLFEPKIHDFEKTIGNTTKLRFEGLCEPCIKDCKHCIKGWALNKNGKCSKKCKEFVEISESVPG